MGLLQLFPYYKKKPVQMSMLQNSEIMKEIPAVFFALTKDLKIYCMVGFNTDGLNN